MFPTSGGHILESAHERIPNSPTIWRRFVSHWHCCIMTIELLCALVFLPDVRKKILERHNGDRAHMLVGEWGPRGVVGDARVDLRVAASASDPKGRC